MVLFAPQASFAGMVFSAEASAKDTVLVQLINNSGGAINRPAFEAVFKIVPIDAL